MLFTDDDDACFCVLVEVEAAISAFGLASCNLRIAGGLTCISCTVFWSLTGAVSEAAVSKMWCILLVLITGI